MRARCSSSSAALSLGLLVFTASVQAHTWVEQMYVVASNGTFVGEPGYARGNVLRISPSFNDGTMTNLIPPNGRSTGNQVLATDPMCKSSQTVGTQTDGSPALSASAGDMVALRYQENGHVTLPQNQPNKPANRGTVYIYGTSKSSNDDKFLSIHNVWNTAGTGGDGRGVLLATRNFDDGQCYQINGGSISATRQKQFAHTAANPMGADLWCQSDVTLPSNLPSSGTYSLYWVWDWPTLGNGPSSAPTLNETYTTCMDINLTAGSGTSKSLNFAKGQDLNSAAIESELSTSIIVQPTASGAAPAADTAPATQSSAPTAAIPQVSSAPAASNPQVPSVGGGSPMSFITVTVTDAAATVTVYKSTTLGGAGAGAQPTQQGSAAAQPSQSSVPAFSQSGAAKSSAALPVPLGSSMVLSVQPFQTASLAGKPTASASGAGTGAASPQTTPAAPSAAEPTPAVEVTTIDTTVTVTDLLVTIIPASPTVGASASSVSVPKIRGRSPVVN